MKETPLSTCEKAFVIKAIQERLRLDGRKLEEFRPLKIHFGQEWGSAHVTLGETRVLAQVSCELGQPKATRPNEGLLYINIELSPMAALHFEAGRSSEVTVQINRILERTFKDSRCVDLESLCVSAEDKVWILRVDLNVLNHEGNIIDCASVAALCALAHFKHPDVTVTGEEIKIHTSAEKDPIPIVLHHYPVCVSYATFQDGEVAIADPTVIEERSAEANMVFGLNSYRELCCLNLGGTTLTSSNLLLQCSHRAANRAKAIVDQIKAALAEDLERRTADQPIGFTECVKMNTINSLAQDRLHLKLRRFNFNLEEDFRNPTYAAPMQVEENDQGAEATEIAENTGVLSSNQNNVRWIPEDSSGTDEDEIFYDKQEADNGASEDDDDSNDDDDDNFDQEMENLAEEMAYKRQNQPISKGASQQQTAKAFSDDNSSDSEEETTTVLG